MVLHYRGDVALYETVLIILFLSDIFILKIPVLLLGCEATFVLFSLSSGPAAKKKFQGRDFDVI